ncbi:hypothetical protein AAG593_09925 [Citromicrobium bathyomarinum]
MSATADEERERIIRWLIADPIPFMRRKATLWERMQSAWIILWNGEVVFRSFCRLLAMKIEEEAHPDRVRGSEDAMARFNLASEEGKQR